MGELKNHVLLCVPMFSTHGFTSCLLSPVFFRAMHAMAEECSLRGSHVLQVYVLVLSAPTAASQCFSWNLFLFFVLLGNGNDAASLFCSLRLHPTRRVAARVCRRVVPP